MAPIKMMRTDPEHSQDGDHNDVDCCRKRCWTRRHMRRQRWRGWKWGVKARCCSDRRDSKDTVVAAWMRHSWGGVADPINSGSGGSSDNANNWSNRV